MNKGKEIISLNDILYWDDDNDNDDNDDVRDKKHEEDYLNWVLENGNYTPAIDVEVVKKMKAGIYKVGVLSDKLTCIPQVNNTDDLFILPNPTINFILQEVEDFWNRKDKFAEYKMVHKRGILLEGPPGTGKTATITLLINELIKNDGLVFIVNSLKDFSFVYEFYKSSLRKIEPIRPIITVIEDIDKIASSSLDTELLDFLDGKASIEHHIVIGTTNDSSNLSDALIRPSRIDTRVLITFPEEDSRLSFFIKKGVKEEDLPMFIKHSKNFSISQLKELFIGVYVLGHEIKQVAHQIKNPLDKQQYSSFSHNKVAMGF